MSVQRRFAAETNVSASETRAEIERVLTRYGASQFMYGTMEDMAVVGFKMGRRTYRIDLPLPDIESREFTHTPERNIPREPYKKRELWEQACRSRWRALLLVIRAKLEAVEIGITSVEREFLGDALVHAGKTFYQWYEPQLVALGDAGCTPPILPGVERLQITDGRK